MITANMLLKTVHEGRNVKRIRKILGIKKNALAIDLGMSIEELSNLEEQETIEDDVLEKLAGALKTDIEAVRGFNEETAVLLIHATQEEDNDNNNYECSFNLIDKITELYETILKSERKQITLLEKMLQERET